MYLNSFLIFIKLKVIHETYITITIMFHVKHKADVLKKNKLVNIAIIKKDYKILFKDMSFINIST